MNSFAQRRVLVTGHTGFKGSWLCEWLLADGAELAGLALPPPESQPSLFQDLKLSSRMKSSLGDIRDLETVEAAMRAFEPEIIFHLAAQPLVRRSYADPVGTFATNVMGTVHVLEAARRCPSVSANPCEVTPTNARANMSGVTSTYPATLLEAITAAASWYPPVVLAICGTVGL